MNVTRSVVPHGGTLDVREEVHMSIEYSTDIVLSHAKLVALQLQHRELVTVNYIFLIQSTITTCTSVKHYCIFPR